MQSRQQKKIDRVLGKLQPAIDSFKPEIKLERKLAIERWLRTYVDYVDYFKDVGEINWSGERLTRDQFEFLIDIFKDEKCWSGNRFNTPVLGSALISEKRGGVENPIGVSGMFELACRYCLESQMRPLLKKVMEEYIDGVNMGGTSSRQGRSDAQIRKELFQSISQDEPVCAFWIEMDEKAEVTLKNRGHYTEIVEAAKLAWPEGIEYFDAKSGELYAAVGAPPRKLRIRDSINDALVEAIKTLSVINCGHKNADALDVCLRLLGEPANRPGLFKRIKNEKDGIYPLLSALVRWGYHDTMERVIGRFQYLCGSENSMDLLSHDKYSLLLSMLSGGLLKDPEHEKEIRYAIELLWKSEHFSDHKKEAFGRSSGFMNPGMKSALACWVIDHANRKDRKGILDILDNIKQITTPDNFAHVKERVCFNLEVQARIGARSEIKYHDLAASLFNELERTCLLSTVGAGGDALAQKQQHAGAQSYDRPREEQSRGHDAPRGHLSDAQAHGRGDGRSLDRK